MRAPGIKGEQDAPESDALSFKGRPQELLALVASALAAVLSSFLLLSSRTSLGRKLGLPSLLSPLDQAEISAYVCGACGLQEEADQLRFAGSHVTYRGIADYLRHRAMASKSQQRRQFAAALRALLLSPRLAPSSVESIRAAIASIEGAAMSDTEFEQLRSQTVDEGSNPVRWRQSIDSFVQEQLREG